MADPEHIKALNDIIDRFDSLDRSKLTRSELDKESLETEITPLLNLIEQYLNIAQKIPDKVANSTLQEINSVADHTVNNLIRIAHHDTPVYINSKEKDLRSVQDHVEDLQKIITPFVVATVIERGLLNDEGIQKQLTDALTALANERKEFKQYIDDIVQGARDAADNIVTSARETATGISVKAAQTQFDEEQTPLKTQTVLWGVMSIVSFIIFFISITYFMSKRPPVESEWHILYDTVLRVTFLSVILSISAFCLRLFRSHMHMYRFNSHRIRVTNSIAAFVQAAATNEQRGIILMRLVDAVTNFGNSGLVHSDTSDMQGSKITIDNFGKHIPNTTDLNK